MAYRKGVSRNRGAANPKAKLSPELVRLVREWRAAGVKLREIVADLKNHYDVVVSIGHVARLAKGEYWPGPAGGDA